jgi:hypothetical protein
MTRSEYVSTLPPWRPVYDIEQRTKQLELNLEPSPLYRRFLAYIANELAGLPQIDPRP